MAIPETQGPFVAIVPAGNYEPDAHDKKRHRLFARQMQETLSHLIHDPNGKAYRFTRVELKEV